MALNFDNSSQLYGRHILTTNRQLTGDAKADAKIVAEILNDVMETHIKNADKETELFKIYINDESTWEKDKSQRGDINNKITVPTAWATTRTLNGYCFSEPIKYIARNIDENKEHTAEEKDKLRLVGDLSALLDAAHNHDCVSMATLSASICGLGYKLCLPPTKEELEETGVPFVLNEKFIFPQLAGIVYSNSSIPQQVMGFLIGTYYDPKTNEPKGNQYTCWTKYNQYLFVDGEGDIPYKLTKQWYDGKETDIVPLIAERIPLIEVERNFLRKGDWEVATDLIKLRNKLISNRADDIDQIIDYIMVLYNCQFETEEEKEKVLKSRLLSVKTSNQTVPADIKIIQNPLDQNGVQVFADYLDLLIQECVGIPNRQERGGGGGDTGQAVKYRNGFRDLDNNAGFIIPKMDKAEMKFLALCIAYCGKVGEHQDIAKLKPYDIRCKFVRTLTDDIVSSSQAFATYYGNGLSMEDALILSKSGTDPSEIATNAQNAFNEKKSYSFMVKTTDNVAEKDTNIAQKEVTAE